MTCSPPITAHLPRAPAQRVQRVGRGEGQAAAAREHAGHHGLGGRRVEVAGEDEGRGGARHHGGQPLQQVRALLRAQGGQQRAAPRLEVGGHHGQLLLRLLVAERGGQHHLGQSEVSTGSRVRSPPIPAHLVALHAPHLQHAGVPGLAAELVSPVEDRAAVRPRVALHVDTGRVGLGHEPDTMTHAVVVMWKENRPEPEHRSTTQNSLPDVADGAERPLERAEVVHLLETDHVRRVPQQLLQYPPPPARVTCHVSRELA